MVKNDPLVTISGSEWEKWYIVVIDDDIVEIHSAATSNSVIATYKDSKVIDVYELDGSELIEILHNSLEDE